MGSNMYVGNISWNASEEDLTTLFGQYGTVKSAKIVTDRDTNRSKGFGFVEMSSPEEAETAISSVNGTEFQGRTIKVDAAKDSTPRRNSFN